MERDQRNHKHGVMVGGTGGGKRYTVAFSLQFHIANLIKLIICLIADFFFFFSAVELTSCLIMV